MDSLYITVFTPTYNRGHLLNRVYNSLLIQNFSNFEWLIVDDGSTDCTEEIVMRLMSENKLTIRYYKKNNGGKHTAINLGVSKALGNLFLILDSDDFLTANALELQYNAWKCIKDKENVIGITGLSIDSNNQVIGTRFKEQCAYRKFTDIYFKDEVKGDKSVAFKTEILAANPFPEPKDITFVLEAVIWHKLAINYLMCVINKPIQIIEYLNEGLTNSNYKKSYLKGLLFSYAQLLEDEVYPFFNYFRPRINVILHFVITSLLLNDFSYFNRISFLDKILYVFLFPRALYSYRNIKKLQNVK